MKIRHVVVFLVMGIFLFAASGCKQADDPETEYYKQLNAHIAQMQPPTAEQQAAQRQKDTDALNVIMRGWIGHSKAELLRQWGVPASTFEDGKGGQIFTYAKSPFGLEDSDPSTRTFYIDARGVIYDGGWHGLWWN